MDIQKRKTGHENLIPSPKGNTGALRHLPPSKYDTFCIHYKLTGSAERAAVYVGYSKKYAHELLAKPAIQARLNTIDSEMLAATIKGVMREFVLTRELLDRKLAYIVVNGLDDGLDGAHVVKAIQVGYRRLGLIR